MARLTLILTVLTTVVALLGGFRLMLDIIQHWRWRRKVTGKWLAALALLTSLWSVSDANAAGRVFYDGFESGNTDQWLQDDFRTKCPVVTVSIDGVAGPYAGSRMLRCNFNPTLGSGNPDYYESLLVNTDTLYTDELFMRTRVRVDTDMNSAQKLLRFYETPGSLYHDLFDVAGHSQNAFNNAGNTTTETLPTYWGDAPGDNTNLPSGWHKSEYYIRQSTGTVKVWHDGVLVRNDVGYNFDNLKWTPFYITSNGDSGDSANHIYFDEFELYSDLGTGATGSMSDASITTGGGGGSTIVLFLEWAPLIIGLLWHARTWLVSAALLIGGATMTTASLSVQKTKQLSTTATISTLNVVSSVLEKVKR